MSAASQRLSGFISARFSGGFRGLFGKLTQAADALPVRLGGTSFSRVTAAPARVAGFDQGLVWVTEAVLAFGLVVVYSASIAKPDNPR
ncbi:MAG: cell division protein FtsW, partial [Burkholderiaceae bacterium]|nr:cell division protein FtsW [Burkholderiaceae bacterium]